MQMQRFLGVAVWGTSGCVVVIYTNCYQKLFLRVNSNVHFIPPSIWYQHDAVRV